MIEVTNSIFPIVKRFKDAKSLSTTVILNEDTTIHEKSFRAGTIFNVLGWKEFKDLQFLIIAKGSWEALVNLKHISTKLETFDGKS